MVLPPPRPTGHTCYAPLARHTASVPSLPCHTISCRRRSVQLSFRPWRCFREQQASPCWTWHASVLRTARQVLGSRAARGSSWGQLEAKVGHRPGQRPPPLSPVTPSSPAAHTPPLSLQPYTRPWKESRASDFTSERNKICAVSDSDDDGAAHEQLRGDGGVDGSLAGDPPLAAEHRLPRQAGPAQHRQQWGLWGDAGRKQCCQHTQPNHSPTAKQQQQQHQQHDVDHIEPVHIVHHVRAVPLLRGIDGVRSDRAVRAAGHEGRAGGALSRLRRQGESHSLISFFSDISTVVTFLQ